VRDARDRLPLALAERLDRLRRGPFPADPDPHLAYIDSHDHRDPSRAAWMVEAVRVARARADAGRRLSLTLLCGMQAIALGQAEVFLRTTDAFGKGGGEGDGYADGLDREIDERLARDADHPVVHRRRLPRHASCSGRKSAPDPLNIRTRLPQNIAAV
jgi:hypothetical protein